MSVYELRQYTLHPGRRDELIELFERELIEPQEAAGMELLGLFRDLDDADRFVWIRGFADMESRRDALAAFYGGPVWKRHRQAANATMIDSDNVLLLRLACGTSFPRTIASPMVHITTFSFDAPVDDGVVEAIHRDLRPLTILRTESAPNTFPALPVREGENVVVTITADAVSAPNAHRLRLEPTRRSAMSVHRQ